MKTILLLLLSALMTTVSAADVVGVNPTQVDVPNATALTLTVPETVSVTKIQPAPTLPPTLKLASKTRKMSLQITFMQHGKIDVSSQDAVNAMVQNMGRAQYEGGSVEKATKVVPLKIKDGLGAIAYYTDADLVNTPNPRPGQFKVVGSAVISIGDTVGVATLLGDDFKSAEFLSAVDILEHGIAKGQAAPPVAAP